MQTPHKDHLPAPLLRLVPPKSKLDTWHDPELLGLSAVELAMLCIERKLNLAFNGPTQVGKTSWPRAVAALLTHVENYRNRYWPVFSVVPGGAVDPSELLGRYVLKGKGKMEWVYGPVSLIVKYGGVLVLDEVNMMPPAISAVLHQLLDDQRFLTLLDHSVDVEANVYDESGNILLDKKGKPVKEKIGMPEVIPAHEDLLIVTTFNLGYYGTERLNEAFKERFLHIGFDYNPDVEEKLIASKALLSVAKDIREANSEGLIQTPFSTKNMLRFQQLWMASGLETAVMFELERYFDEEEKSSIRRMFEMREREFMADNAWFAPAIYTDLDEELEELIEDETEAYDEEDVEA